MADSSDDGKPSLADVRKPATVCSSSRNRVVAWVCEICTFLILLPKVTNEGVGVMQ